MSKFPRVLQISVRADIGGGPKHLLDLITEYETLGLETYCAVPNRGEYSKLIQEKSKDSFHIPYRKFSFFKLLQLIFFCKKRDIKVVHSHGRGAGLYSRLMKLFGFQVIHTFHGVHIEDDFIGNIKLLVDKILSILTDKFICVSNSEKDLALKHKVGNSKIKVITNGVFVPQRKEVPANEVLLVGTLSRLTYQKGLDILIEYISKFIQKNSVQFKILIAGDGELSEELEKLIQIKEIDSFVELVGKTDRPVDFLNTLDVYISFARWEGMPLGVLEAMGVGAPVVLSNVTGNKDIVSNNEDGVLFELDDYMSFEQAFTKVLSDTKFRTDLSLKGASKVQMKFSRQRWPKRQQVYIYENLIYS